MTNEIAVTDRPSALTDLRLAAMSLPAETMSLALAEFDERRMAFRRWLMSHLVEGVHYGFPPGCMPDQRIDPKQWKGKQSLYKAGADFCAELMAWRCEFENDVLTWEMLGKPTTVCMTCRLIDSAGKQVGMGRGGFARGAKKMSDNATIKMAEKCAKVGAVIHALNLSDLFSQDLEDDQAPHENPAVNPRTPRQAPRGERVTKEDIERLSATYKTLNPGCDLQSWREYVHYITNVDFDPRSLAKWTRTMVDAVSRELATEMGGQP